MWATHHSSDLPGLLAFGMYLSAFSEPQLLGRLASLGVLPEPVRAEAARMVADFALDFDPGWVEASVVRIFTDAEREELLRRLEDEVVPDPESYVDQASDGWDSDTHPEERFRYAREAIDEIKAAFRENESAASACDEASSYIESCIRSHEEEFEPPPSREHLAPAPVTNSDPCGARDPFDDVADGH
jgi:hypothetical protein